MKIKDININCITYGNELGKPIVFLHGWGQNIEMMKPLANRLSNDYKIILLIYQVMGKSDEPLYPWSVMDYMEAIKELLEKLDIKCPTLVGHSFGEK